MSWVLACLPVYCVHRAIFAPHASWRPHSKVEQGTPHFSFPAVQWKQTFRSASNKSQPVVAGWAAYQSGPQVQDLIRRKKWQSMLFCWLQIRVRWSGGWRSRKKVAVSNTIHLHMQGGWRGRGRQTLLQQRSWWGLKHNLLSKYMLRLMYMYCISSHVIQVGICADNWGLLIGGWEDDMWDKPRKC